jgi:ferrous iron transport protein A
MKTKSLAELYAGESAEIAGIELQGPAAERLRALGLTDGTKVTKLRAAPSGDPAAYLFRGAVIALRNADAAKIAVVPGDGARV